jgi:hypothetical protein
MKQTRRQTRRKQTRRRKRGGTKIGKGASGNIYYPAIPCNDLDTSQYVSKVFSNKYEFNKLKYEISDSLSTLVKIDPKQEYFLYPIFCESFGDLSDENKKDGITEDNKVYSYLVKKGGKSVETILLEKMKFMMSYDEKLKFLKPIVAEAIRLNTILTKAGLQHNDFHPGNLVIMPDNSYRVIDFDRVGRYDKSVPSKDIIDFVESSSALMDIEYDDEVKTDLLV